MTVLQPWQDHAEYRRGARVAARVQASYRQRGRHPVAAVPVTNGTRELFVICSAFAHTTTTLARYVPPHSYLYSGVLKPDSQEGKPCLGLYASGSTGIGEEYVQGQALLREAISLWRADENLGEAVEEAATQSLSANYPRSMSLPNAIEIAFGKSRFDQDSEEAAGKARDEAVAFAERELLHSNPEVDISSDGVITLQWRSSGSGVMLVFVGDGALAYSVKSPGGRYGLSVRELPISSALPPDVLAEIRKLDAGSHGRSGHFTLP